MESISTENIIRDTVAAFRSALGNLSEDFNVNASISDFRPGEDECCLSVEVANRPEKMKENSVFLCALWSKESKVQLLVGEYEDNELDLTPENLWSLLYSSTFYLPE